MRHLRLTPFVLVLCLMPSCRSAIASDEPDSRLDSQTAEDGFAAEATCTPRATFAQPGPRCLACQDDGLWLQAVSDPLAGALVSITHLASGALVLADTPGRTKVWRVDQATVKPLGGAKGVYVAASCGNSRRLIVGEFGGAPLSGWLGQIAESGEITGTSMAPGYETRWTGCATNPWSVSEDEHVWIVGAAQTALAQPWHGLLGTAQAGSLAVEIAPLPPALSDGGIFTAIAHVEGTLVVMLQLARAGSGDGMAIAWVDQGTVQEVQKLSADIPFSHGISARGKSACVVGGLLWKNVAAIARRGGHPVTVIEPKQLGLQTILGVVAGPNGFLVGGASKDQRLGIRQVTETGVVWDSDDLDLGGGVVSVAFSRPVASAEPVVLAVQLFGEGGYDGISVMNLDRWDHVSCNSAFACAGKACQPGSWCAAGVCKPF